MSDISLIDLRAQFADLQADMEAAILDTLRSGRYIGGAAVADFEAAFAEFCGTERAVACANGTDALELLLDARQIGPGDEVIVPAMSWISTSEVVATRGAVPIFVDIDPGTYCIDPEGVAAAISPRTRAIIAVHLYGHPADMTALTALAAEHDLFLIEDCAQAHGARWAEQPIGTFGAAGSFSFFPSKSLGAYGDAGAIITNDGALADTVHALANHGMRGVRHVHQLHGRNSRLDALQAAVLNVKLRHLAGWIARKNALAERYRERLSVLDPTELQLPAVDPAAYHGYHLFVVRTARRDALSAHLSARGIGNTVHYPTALPLHACYSHRRLPASDYPEAVALSRTALSIPMYAELTEEQLDRICSAIISFFRA